MKYRICIAMLFLACAAGDASAAANFTYQKTITAFPSPSIIRGRFTAMAGAPAGGLYIVSSSIDGYAYMPDPINDSVTSIAVTTDGSFGTGNSFAGVTVAPNGTTYAGGKDDPALFNSTFWKGEPDAAPATSFVATKLDSLSATYSGPAAVSNDTIVVGGDDGSLTFYQNASGSTLTALSPAGIIGGGAQPKSLVYDAIGGKIYEASSVGATITGKVNVFVSNGTPAGTSSGTVYDSGVPTTLAITEQGMRYQSIALGSTARLLAVARNSGTSGANNTGWAIYNLNTNATIDFITLGPADVPGGTALTGAAGSTGAQQAQGCAFVEKGGSTYLILSTGTGSAAGPNVSRAFVFKLNNAGVADWTIY